MSKVAVVYWSSTGNTEEMAKAVAQGVRGAGASCDLLTCGQMDAARAKQYDALIFGCPAMSAETLEEDEFEPMFSAVKGALSGKNVALFGSYGWGGGEWMRTWAERTRMDGAKLYNDGLIVENGPTDDDLKNCVKLGEEFARSIEA